MSGHSTTRRPILERLEERQPLSANAATATLVSLRAGSRPLASHAYGTAAAMRAVGDAPGVYGAVPIRQGSTVPRGNASAEADVQRSVSATAVKPEFGFLVYRITNPNPFNDRITPPVNHVMVQARQPVPGQVYNVLYVIVRIGTARTFDASDGFRVRFPGQHISFPILTGNEQWRQGEWIVFYVLTKKYYPMPNVVSSGFEFDLGGAYSAAIPGPSGIFLRLKYNPATIDRTLDWIVTHSPGVPGGPRGIKFGLPDTAIYEVLSARTDRTDFGGYF